MEHVGSCNLCPWRESWTTREAAEAAAVWHIYDEHRAVWFELTGTPDPLAVTKMPTDYGRKLEPWESQDRSRALQDIANGIRAEWGLPPLDPPNPITGFQRR